jgi:peptidoglycan/LPS O-acetylase OafA/YrhL
MVVLSHSSEFLYRLSNNQHIGPAVHQFVDMMQPLGILGVELFFVLSGFLIGNILIRTFMEPEEFTFGTVRNFWIRRWMRTIPVYWLILTADIVLYKTIGLGNFHSLHGLYYLFMQNLWYPHPHFFFGEAWSLSVEEWFYLTLPIVLLLTAKLLKPANKKQFLLRVFMGYLLVFVLARFFNAFDPINGQEAGQDFGIRKVVVFRLDAVMYGVLFAYMNYFNKGLLLRLKNKLLLLCIPLVTLVYYLLEKDMPALCSSPNGTIRFFSDAFLYLYIPLSLSLCLPFANNVKNAGSKYIEATVTHISKISYAMYLVHYSMIYIPFFDKLALTSTGSIIGLYLLYWVIVLTLSTLLYRFYERPIMLLRDKISK